MQKVKPLVGLINYIADFIVWYTSPSKCHSIQACIDFFSLKIVMQKSSNNHNIYTMCIIHFFFFYIIVQGYGGRKRFTVIFRIIIFSVELPVEKKGFVTLK